MHAMILAMKFLLGSASDRKLETVKHVILSMNIDGNVKGHEVPSGVPPTPWDADTKTGARNRAINCRQLEPATEMCVGLESGLVIRYGDAYEEAWACVINLSGKEFLGYSSGLRLPQVIVDTMNLTGKGHNDVMRELRQEKGLLGTEKDTWGDYTGGQLLRNTSLEEALRNALIQALASETSLYHPSHAHEAEKS
jgi:non-canonical (house-cleaning) NTP pyrophosphatase